MTHRHPNDPQAQHHAAETLGRMEADGLLPEGEANKTLATIIRTARANAPNVDAKSLRARLVWSARDARLDRHQQRANAATAVRWASRPLIDAKAAPDVIWQAGKRAAGDALTDAEVRSILAEEWNRAHKRRGRK